MSSVLGKNLKVSVFGQSHSAAIGCCIDGLPAGEVIDRAALLEFMRRRAPGRNSYSTARKEDDLPEFLSGVLENEAG
ncbi:MAG: chorismate synthase, partial [Bacteroidales bacterium]